MLDIHTHNLQASCDAVISVAPSQFAPVAGKLYSVGIHPWFSAEEAARELPLLEDAASHPQVVALGETGLDGVKGMDIALQQRYFAAHIDLAKQMHKPVIVHMVRTSQQVAKACRGAGVPVIIHGMRGNENVARTLIDAGFYISYGAHFNPAALQATPLDRLLVETDDTPVAIETVLEKVSQALSIPTPALTLTVQRNAATLLSL
ncbi:MAG: TatD family hydrolase [Bacteroidales bacterium]|nr:TatD family hydrolase [Candidatus Sodaliphilus limicaballi]